MISGITGGITGGRPDLTVNVLTKDGAPETI